MESRNRRMKKAIPALVIGVLSIIFWRGDKTMNDQSQQSDLSARETQADAYASPAPEDIRKNGNRLKHENSLYLKQHAHNPMDWYPWGEAALSRARVEDKPIFLSIGYASCHWCHVMEDQVFVRDDIADYMNHNYINIKVDREERPDLDAVYMEAVQALTGGGGWPMSVFLTPDLKPFYGGTYFPPDKFISIVAQLSDIYRNQRSQVEAQADSVKAYVARNPLSSGGSAVTLETLNDIVAKTAAFYDEEWGGFSEQMKFPTPVRWLFLLHYYRKTGDDKISAMIRNTLDKMGSGGLFDYIGGGFHRYTVERTWLIPHFEKMLYDNAQLASLYLEASVVFDNDEYADIARATLDFMIDQMSGNEGGCYASYDADSDGKEGSFYLWMYHDIIEVAGLSDGPPLAVLLGITPEGNFEGKNIITRRIEVAEVASRFEKSEAEIAGLLQKYLPLLRSKRESRAKPGLDKKIITSWNGLAIAALADGYMVLGDEKYRRAVERAADYLWQNHHRQDNGLYRSSYGGKGENDAILDDYAFLAAGLLKLSEATGEAKYVKRAFDLIDYVQANFKGSDGSYYLTQSDRPTPLGRKIEIFDSVRPSGNAAMLQVLIKAAAISGNTKLLDEARRLAGANAENIRKAGLEMAWMMDGALKLIGPYYELVIAGDPESEETQDLTSAFRRQFPSHAVMITVPAGGITKAESILLASAADKTAIGGNSTAYVCQFGTCKLPTNDPATMLKQLMEGWKL